MSHVMEPARIKDHMVLDRNGDKIGKVEELYYERDGEPPEWALVHTGLLGTKKSFVPLQGATPAGEDIRLPIERVQVKAAPRAQKEDELSEAEEQRLFEHYGIPYATTGETAVAGSAPAHAHLHRYDPAPASERAGSVRRDGI